MMVKFTIIWLDKASGKGGKYTCRVKARHFFPMFRSGRRHPQGPTAVPTLYAIHARPDGVQSSP